MKKKLILGILSAILLFLSIILSVETPYNRPVGDIMLNALGLNAWSNGNIGFHYTILYSLVFFIIGLIGTKYFLKERFPNFIKRLPLILFIFLISYPIFVGYSVKVMKYNSEGLCSIYYAKKESILEYEVNEEDEYIILRGHFKFKNYGKEHLKFYIKYIDERAYLNDLVVDKEIVALNVATNKPKLFTIPPKSTINVDAVFKVKKKDNVAGSGTMREVNILLFNDKEEIDFIENTIWGITL